MIYGGSLLIERLDLTFTMFTTVYKNTLQIPVLLYGYLLIDC